MNSSDTSIAKSILLGASAFLIAIMAANSVFAAESLSVLLQKGIFAEETEGNLENAIKIYEQIATEAAANATIVAQAQYRLAVCYEKKGKNEQAIGILNKLRAQFPAEVAITKKAGDLLAKMGQTPSNAISLRKIPLDAAEVFCVSADGRLVAYKPKGGANVAIFETATGKSWTVFKGYSECVRISRDGRFIAYLLTNAVHVAKIDGTESKKVSANKNEPEWWIDGWSPNGDRLLIEYGQEESTVGWLDLKTGTVKEIKRWAPPSHLGQMRLSWNGRYLACRFGGLARNENRQKISILDLESGSESTLIEKEVRDVVGWFPGDEKFLFSSSRSGTPGLWAVAVRDGKPVGEPELVKLNVGEISPYTFTQDGSYFYAERKSSEDIYLAAANFQTGEILSQPRRAAADRLPGLQSHPVWSKDGQKLMFVVQQGEKRFVSVTLATGERKEFPVAETFWTPLQRYDWSRDGAYLLVQSSTLAAGHGIHRYNLASGATEMFVKTMNSKVPGYWICHPRFAPDENSFYYTRRDFFKGPDQQDDWKDSIIRRNLRSGNEEIVFASPDKLQTRSPYELSPDGTRLAIVASNQYATNDFTVAIKVRGVSGGETKELARMAPRENVTSVAWTPDGKRIVYAKQLRGEGEEGSLPTEVWSVSTDSGQSVRIKLSTPNIRELTINPDGLQIAYFAGSWEGQDLWVMENFVGTQASAK